MRFSKTDNIYKVIRITGSQNNILGICFVEKNSSEANIEVIEWNFSNSDRSKIQTSKEEVLEQVISGLESVNQSINLLEQIINYLKFILHLRISQQIVFTQV
jgi:hypothetical protein